MGKFFSSEKNWHQDDRAKPFVRQYELALEAALKPYPELQDCVVSCARCEIRFLTHPRNARRRDLRCPFGCREHHRGQESSQRSAAYYRTEAGRERKRHLNNGRKRRCPSADSLPPQAPVASPSPAPEPRPLPSEAPPQSAPSAQLELRLEGVVLDEPTLRNSPLLPYVRTVVNLLEGLRLDLSQLVALLLAVLRQRSIGLRRRRDYVREYLHQHPPE